MKRKKRTAKIDRKTGETDIKLSLNIDGSGKSKIDTKIPFMDHMLELFSKHGLFDLTITARGDLQVDAHHTMEDIGIVLGSAFKKALGDKKGIERFSSVKLPMDESEAEVVIDISGRPFLQYSAKIPGGSAGDLPAEVFREFFEAFTTNMGLTLHVTLIKSGNSHHAVEAIFKAFGVALLKACQHNPRKSGVPSTKGVL